MLGVSLPWIDSKKDSDDNNDDHSNDGSTSMFKESKTTIYTYKIGPCITARQNLNDYFSLYENLTYAYQTGRFKNDIMNIDMSTNGIFQEYEFGIRFQPVSIDHDMGFFTLSPRLYATLGYRYTSWDLKNVNLNITGIDMPMIKTDFSMNASVVYFGLGYSF